MSNRCVNTFAELKAAAPGTTSDCSILLKGYWSIGDGGGGFFVWDILASEWENNDGTVVRPTRLRSGTAGAWKRIHDAGVVNVKWFGARGDDTGNDAPAFMAAIRSIRDNPAIPPMWLSELRGPLVVVPPGRYRMTEPLVIDRQIVLRGAGNFLGEVATQLAFFNGGQDGVRIEKGAVLQDLWIASDQSTSSETGHGIFVTSKCVIERCEIRSFRGDGIHIYAAIPTSASGWTIRNVRINQCRNGIMTIGPDVNGGVCEAADVSDNREWGILESSFLGNTYIACMAHNNGSSSYDTFGAFTTTDLNARSCFIGCYAEDDRGGRVVINSPSLLLGGFSGHKNEGSGGSMYVVLGSTIFRNTVRCANTWDPDVMVVSGLGSASSVGKVALEFEAAGQPTYRLHYGFLTPGWWELACGNTSGVPLAFSGTEAAEGAGEVWFPSGFFINVQNFRKKIYVGPPVPPDSGTWRQGDRLLNTNNVAPGQPAGWVCVEASSMAHPRGRWCAYGTIDSTIID